MKTTKIGRLWMIPWLALATPWTVLSAEEAEIGVHPRADNALVLGIFPRRNAAVTIKLFRPMAEYLSAELQRDVQIKTNKNFNIFWDELKAEKFDIVHFNQYHYVVARKEFGYEVILKNEEQNQATIAGSVLVRKDSGLKTIADLKGRKIVFGGGPKAMQSYIVATYLLRQGGLQAGDYVEEFAKNPPNAIMSAYYHQADAAGSGDGVLMLPVVRQKIDINQMHFLVRGEQLPHLPWAIRKDLPWELRLQIQRLLIDLKNHDKGRAILKKARLTGLRLATDPEYNPHREIIHAVYGEQY